MKFSVLRAILEEYRSIDTPAIHFVRSLLEQYQSQSNDESLSVAQLYQLMSGIRFDSHSEEWITLIYNELNHNHMLDIFYAIKADTDRTLEFLATIRALSSDNLNFIHAIFHTKIQHAQLTEMTPDILLLNLIDCIESFVSNQSTLDLFKQCIEFAPANVIEPIIYSTLLYSRTREFDMEYIKYYLMSCATLQILNHDFLKKGEEYFFRQTRKYNDLLKNIHDSLKMINDHAVFGPQMMMLIQRYMKAARYQNALNLFKQLNVLLKTCMPVIRYFYEKSPKELSSACIALVCNTFNHLTQEQVNDVMQFVSNQHKLNAQLHEKLLNKLFNVEHHQVKNEGATTAIEHHFRLQDFANLYHIYVLFSNNNVIITDIIQTKTETLSRSMIEQLHHILVNLATFGLFSTENIEKAYSYVSQAFPKITMSALTTNHNKDYRHVVLKADNAESIQYLEKIYFIDNGAYGELKAGYATLEATEPSYAIKYMDSEKTKLKEKIHVQAKREVNCNRLLGRNAFFYRDSSCEYYDRAVVMDWLQGKTLAKYTELELRAISLFDRFKACLPLLQELNRIHSVNHMHSDLDPRNIMLEASTPAAHLFDFSGSVRVKPSEDRIMWTPWASSLKRHPSEDLYSLGYSMMKLFPELFVMLNSSVNISDLRCTQQIGKRINQANPNTLEIAIYQLVEAMTAQDYTDRCHSQSALEYCTKVVNAGLDLDTNTLKKITEQTISHHEIAVDDILRDAYKRHM